MQKTFDSNPPLNERAPVLNISKVFGKVWYEHLPILLFYMVEGNLAKTNHTLFLFQTATNSY